MATTIGTTPISGIGDSWMPATTDNADIQAALKYLYYGSTGVATTSGIYGALANLIASPTFTGSPTITGSLSINGGTLSGTSTTANIFNTTATTLNIGGAATTVNIGASTGTTSIKNALSVTGTITGTLSGNASTSTNIAVPSNTAATFKSNANTTVSYNIGTSTASLVGKIFVQSSQPDSTVSNAGDLWFW